MAYKKKKTFFYAGSQKVPDPKAEVHHAPPGYNNGAPNSVGGNAAGGGSRFSRFQRGGRFNGGNEEGDEMDAYTSSEPAAVIQLDKKKKITVRSYRGIKLVDIREFFTKRNDDGMNQELPGKKGISLTEDAWNKLVSQVEAVQDALSKLDDPAALEKSALEKRENEILEEDQAKKKQKSNDGTAVQVKKERTKIKSESKEEELVDSEEEESEDEVILSNHPIASSAVKQTSNEDSSDDDSEDDDADAAAALEAAMLEEDLEEKEGEDEEPSGDESEEE